MEVFEAFTIQCPACGKSLQVPPQLAGKRAKCSCGQVLQVPATPNQAAQAAGLTLGYRGASPKGHSPNEEHAAVIRQAIIYSALLVLLVGLVFAVRFVGTRYSANSKAAVAATPGEDAMVSEMIDNENGTEAREWLAGHPGRMLSGMTTSQAQSRIDQWYRMGATKVYAFGGVLSMSAVLELPADPAQRKALIDWTNDWNAKSLVKPTPDVGQKYLLVRLRL
jgi:hypothetical protein